MHTLLFLEPGHFHAALLLRFANPRVSSTIHVYAERGPELEAFRGLVDSFNARDRNPTAWELVVHDGRAPRARLIEERRGEIAVLAGRNNSKLDNIQALHEAGFSVLADKPWLVHPDALGALETVTAGSPLVMDIMTSRHDSLARLRRHLVRSQAVFGGFADSDDGTPAIELAIAHHLYKRVNGKPLRRPAWYFDTAVQGDGLTDIQSHMLDQAQWMLAPENGALLESELIEATRWTTRVDRSLFADCTGSESFPDSLRPALTDGVLEYACNGRIRYRLGGQLVQQSAEWFGREPEGSGDQHSGQVRGVLCEIGTRLGPDTGFRPALVVTPAPGADIAAALDDLVERLQPELPGVAAERSGDAFRLQVPSSIEGGHETHFPLVLDEFLTQFEAGWSASRAATIRQRYGLLAEAQASVCLARSG